jgi:hypothetical protein
MYRILYHTADGRIETCRKMSDSLLAQQLKLTPQLASIDGYVADKSVKKVNLDTLELEDVVNTQITVDPMHYLRLHRNKKLQACDWTQGVDSPLTDAKKTEWANYRQSLRNLPNGLTLNSIEDIVWPTQPE